MRGARTLPDDHQVRIYTQSLDVQGQLLSRSSQRGGTIRVNASKAISTTMSRALARVNASITSKLDDFFGLSEYDWTPNTRETEPSMYLYELINWLTTVVDSLQVKETYKDEAYRGAVVYISDCLLVSR